MICSFLLFIQQFLLEGHTIENVANAFINMWNKTFGLRSEDRSQISCNLSKSRLGLEIHKGSLSPKRNHRFRCAAWHDPAKIGLHLGNSI